MLHWAKQNITVCSISRVSRKVSAWMQDRMAGRSIGEVMAAKILARTGAISRFRSESAFASFCGVAPIEVCSGDVQRQILAEVGVMTSLALLAGVLVAIQFPLLDVIYFVEPHVYVIGLAISVSAIYVLTLTCAWYPSRIATRVEPAEALRYE